MSQEQRARGAFYGLLVGDALGAPVEFKKRGTFPEVREMIPCTNFGGLPAGAFTDDGSMMLCLASSIIANKGKQGAATVLAKYSKWALEGYMSSIDRCFDIGNTIREAILDYCRNNVLEAATSEPYKAGNGSLMRIAPIPIVWNASPSEAWRQGEISSRTTHTNPECIWACGFFSALCAMAIGSAATKETLLNYTRDHYGSKYKSFEGKTRDQIRTSGYVVHTLEAALWAFFSTETFEDGLILIVNMGDDADTVGAVFGCLAGAYYGIDAIPARWRGALLKPELLEDTFRGLWAVRA